MSLRSFSPMLCLVLAACQGGSDTPAAPQPTATATATATASATPTASATASVTGAPTGANEVKETNDLYSFAYSWPAAAGNIPALAQRLEGQLEKSKQELIDSANKGKEEAESNGFPYNTYYFSEKWNVVANLPGWLSLTGDFSTYTGGAHGNYGRETIVWDKKVGRGFPAIEMFTSPKALGDALGKKLCAALDAERAKRRKGQPRGMGLPEFDKCVGVDEATVLVGSSNGRTFNRVGVWFGPYVAGPYAEGAYELTFGVDKAVLGAVKPTYEPAFSRVR
uniref:DUF4163 domain-containing protein n=1 Tax=Altererythrobacter segetis TaxID=1104773 RepID=UPI00140BFF89|nr:DUF4163 domain-containing protein [Altererythrobacter segetis]